MIMNRATAQPFALVAAWCLVGLSIVAGAVVGLDRYRIASQAEQDAPGGARPPAPLSVPQLAPLPVPAPPLVPPAARDYGEQSWYLTHSEPVCVALVVWAEARGEPLEGKLAVADLVLNRVDGAAGALTPCEVAHQLRQFAIAGAGGVPRPGAEDPIWRATLFAAVVAMADRASPSPAAHVDQVHGACFMISPANMPRERARWPSWARAAHKVASVGGHEFFACAAVPDLSASVP